MGKNRSEAGQWLLMRDYKAISNAMEASGGPSVTTSGNINNKEWESISWKNNILEV